MLSFQQALAAAVALDTPQAKRCWQLQAAMLAPAWRQLPDWALSQSLRVEAVEGVEAASDFVPASSPRLPCSAEAYRGLQHSDSGTAFGTPSALGQSEHEAEEALGAAAAHGC